MRQGILTGYQSKEEQNHGSTEEVQTNGYAFVPSDLWMRGSYYSLSEEEVHNEQDQNTCIFIVVSHQDLRLYTNENNGESSPAWTKICAAMATDTFISRYAQTMRMMHVSVLAMQKPKIKFVMKNLWPCRLFVCIMIILATAALTNRARNTAVMGTSRDDEGVNPNAAV